MYHRIMIPIDGSTTAERGLREAIGLIEGHLVTLHLLHVVDIAPLMMDMAVTVGSAEMIERLRQVGNEVLSTARRRLEELGIAVETTLLEVTHGHVAGTIIEDARVSGCDLIVMGTHGRRGIRRLAMGSDAENVVRTSSVPVLLVRDAPAH